MDRHVRLALNHAANYPLLIDDIGCAACCVALRVPDIVGLDHFVLRPIAEHRERQLQVLGEDALRGPGVDADTEDLGIGLLELLIGVPEGAKLFLSAAGEGQLVEGDDHVLLAAIVSGSISRLAVHQGELRRLIATFRSQRVSFGGRDVFLLCQGRQLTRWGTDKRMASIEPDAAKASALQPCRGA
jgi:hypothetical protein